MNHLPRLVVNLPVHRRPHQRVVRIQNLQRLAQLHRPNLNNLKWQSGVRKILAHRALVPLQIKYYIVHPSPHFSCHDLGSHPVSFSRHTPAKPQPSLFSYGEYFPYYTPFPPACHEKNSALSIAPPSPRRGAYSLATWLPLRGSCRRSRLRGVQTFRSYGMREEIPLLHEGATPPLRQTWLPLWGSCQYRRH